MDINKIPCKPIMLWSVEIIEEVVAEMSIDYQMEGRLEIASTDLQNPRESILCFVKSGDPR